jgi:hypothetical protein
MTKFKGFPLVIAIGEGGQLVWKLRRIWSRQAGSLGYKAILKLLK